MLNVCVMSMTVRFGTHVSATMAIENLACITSLMYMVFENALKNVKKFKQKDNKIGIIH